MSHELEQAILAMLQCIIKDTRNSDLRRRASYLRGAIIYGFRLD